MLRWIKVLPYFIFLIFTACSLEVGITDLKAFDFLNSKILSHTDGIGDGVNELVVVLELRNSDNSFAINHVPKIERVSGIEFTALKCEESNSEGVAICKIRSVHFGKAMIKLVENEVFIVETEVSFDPPNRNGTFLQVLSAAQHHEVIGDNLVSAQVGAPVLGMYNKVNNHHFFNNTTSAMTPIKETISVENSSN